MHKLNQFNGVPDRVHRPAPTAAAPGVSEIYTPYRPHVTASTVPPLIPQAVVHRGPAIPEIDGGQVRDGTVWHRYDRHRAVGITAYRNHRERRWATARQ